MKVSPMTTETLEQARERIAEKCLKRLTGTITDWNKPIMQAALLEYGNLVGAEIERLRKDAGRYEYIRSNPDSDIFLVQDTPAGYNGGSYMILELAWKAPRWEKYTPEHLDDAIDAAMAQVKEKA